MTLSKETRDAVGRVVADLRRLFEDDFGAQTAARYGLHVEPRRGVHVEDEEALTLSAEDMRRRRELTDVVAYLQSQGHAQGDAIARLVREAAFTAVNRLLAVRVAEAVGAIPPSLAEGRRSRGFLEFIDLFPQLKHRPDGGFWAYLQACGDELAPEVPALFDRRHPMTAFVPSPGTLDQSLELISTPTLADVWREPEALGWAYQFFNSDAERRRFRDEARSGPRNSRELAVLNQFFTPRYVVDWLVQNTLGRRLREAGYEVDLPLLEGEPGSDLPLNLEEIRILDPAVGSGHFLLGCYDLLEEAWKGQGVEPSDAAMRIIPCLRGIEIDHRAAQVAQAVLLLRARRSAPKTGIPAPQIVTARALPRTGAAEEAVLEDTPNVVRRLAEELRDALQDAPILGSLLRVDEHLRTGWFAQGQLGDEALRDFSEAKAQILGTLQQVASGAEARPEERLFAADATDALDFTAACLDQYDIVLMNPPFGSPVPSTKDYLKAAYGNSAVDLYAAFVHRGVEWLHEGGYLGAITNRTGFFLRSYEGWRSELVLRRIRTLIDLGHGVMHDAMVEAAAYVVGADPTATPAVFRRLLDQPDRDAAVRKLSSGDRFEVAPREFEAVPGAPAAYWPSPTIRSLFREFPPLENEHCDVRVGLQTSDDFRFLRLWWEAPPEERGRGRRWVPFAKGGEYAPYYADLHLVVDWEDEGRRIEEWGRGRPQNTQHYYRPGLTWPRRTASAFGVRPLPEDCIFSDKGPIIGSDSLCELLAWANSRPTRYLVELQLAAGETTVSGSAARSYEIGIVQKLPLPALPSELSSLAISLYETAARPCLANETSPLFTSPLFDPYAWEREAATQLENAARLDELVAEAYGLGSSDLDDLDAEVGPAPASYPDSDQIDEADFANLYVRPIDDLVDEALDRVGAARHLAMKSYVLDRRLELLAHTLQANPVPLVQLREELDLRRPGHEEDQAFKILSFLMGVAMGRWQATATENSPSPPADPFAPLPAIPPAMTSDSPSSQSEKRAPPNGVLHDEPGHEWDVVAAMEGAASVAPAIGHEGLVDVIDRLGAKDVGSYMRKKFFARHLKMYSVGRRKAPIYWHLTVPSMRWGLWVYAPRFSREVLFAIVRAAEEKHRRLAVRSQDLRAQVEGESGRETRQRLEELDSLGDEVEAFLKHATAVAESGWSPDLNDGFVLCAAPLAELFVDRSWMKEIAKHREALEQGKYPWATVQRDYFRPLT